MTDTTPPTPPETPDDLPCRVCDHGSTPCPCRACYIESRLQHRTLLAIVAAEDKARQEAA